MWSGRRTTICREGLYYLCVALFIVGGAVLRERNLLVLLAGILLGPLVIHWRLVGWMLRRVTVTRQLPRRICVGDPLIVEITATNGRRRLASWAVSVRDSIQRLGDDMADDRTSVEVLLPHIGAGQTRATSYRCSLTRRGRYRFGPLKVTTRFPLGLVQASFTDRNDDTLIVCPRLGTLTRRWRQLFEAERRGTQRHHSQGGLTAGDYYGLRAWQAGDSQRWIHWRTSAKLGKLAVRQFEQQRGRDLALLVDLWQPKRTDAASRDRVELAVSFAATVVANASQRSGGLLMASVSGAETRFWGAAPATRVLTQEILEQLSTVEPGDGQHLPDQLTQLLQQRRRGMRVVVISTRPPHWDAVFPQARQATSRSLDKPSGSLWLDVGSPDLEHFFRNA